MTFRIFSLMYPSIIGIFTGKKSNNLAHAQAVDSRPSFKGWWRRLWIPGRVFAFITVTRANNYTCVKFSCICGQQNIYNRNLYTENAHRELLHKGLGVASCAAARLYSDPGQLQDDWMPSNYISKRFSRLLDFSDSRPQLVILEKT